MHCLLLVLLHACGVVAGMAAVAWMHAPLPLARFGLPWSRQVVGIRQLRANSMLCTILHQELCEVACGINTTTNTVDAC